MPREKDTHKHPLTRELGPPDKLRGVIGSGPVRQLDHGQLAYLTDDTHPQYLTVARGNDEYLRLDCTNDPLTDTLETQALVPDEAETRDIGTSALPYGLVSAGQLRIINPVLKGATPPTINLGSADHLVCSYYQNEEGTTTITAQNAMGGSFIGAPSFVFGGTVDSDAAGTGGDKELSSVGPGSVAIGVVQNSAYTSSPNVSKSYLWSASPGSLAGGCAERTGGSGAVLANNTNSIEAASTGGSPSGSLASGSFAWGRAYGNKNDSHAHIYARGYGAMAVGSAGTVNGTSTQAAIWANQSGSFAGGNCAAGTTGITYIYANGSGAFAHGNASNAGRIQAAGNGACALGITSGGAWIQADGAGSFASGSTTGTSSIRALQDGSMAVGSTASGGNIDANAVNAFQLGIGANTVATSIQVGALSASGTGVRMCGANPTLTTNGEFKVNGSGQFQFYSGSNTITLYQVNTYTQAYSTAARTNPAIQCPVLTDSTGGAATNQDLATLAAITDTTVGAGMTATQRSDVDARLATANDNFRECVEAIQAIRQDIVNAKQLLNGIVDDLQASSGVGFFGG